MCSCDGVQEILDYRRKLEARFGPCRFWQARSEPMKLLAEYKRTKVAVSVGGLTMAGNKYLAWWEDGWFFWDEAYCLHGPYPTPAHAFAALVCYCWEELG